MVRISVRKLHRLSTYASKNDKYRIVRGINETIGYARNKREAKGMANRVRSVYKRRRR